MSVSMRSTKAQLYSEIERLRALCDWQAQQLRAYRTDQQRADQQRADQPYGTSDLRVLQRMCKGFAKKYRCTARLRDGVIELYSKRCQRWVAVPAGTRP